MRNNKKGKEKQFFFTNHQMIRLYYLNYTLVVLPKQFEDFPTPYGDIQLFEKKYVRKRKILETKSQCL